MPLDIVPVHVEWVIMRNFMASAIESELGGIFENFQKATSTRKDLVDMGNLQPPKPVAIDNTAANSSKQHI